MDKRDFTLKGMLASPVVDWDNEEKARRKVLREYALPQEIPSRFQTPFVIHRRLAGIIAELGPLSEQHGLANFLKNVDYANILTGFVLDLSHAVSDYQVSANTSISRDI